MSGLAYYPPNPENIDPQLTAPSAAFRKQVVKVIVSLLLFCSAYLALLYLTAVLAIAIMYGGMMLVARDSGVSVILGLGVIGGGILLLYFLVKFMLNRRGSKDPNRVEIHEAEHPDLFAFIRQLAKDTGTGMPRKVYLTADVNALVFYDADILSLFYPVKKNLVIGLGLVNILTLSEFKMVLAHEFGHFTQRSMKLGTYVYTVNRIIVNQLFENDKWGGTPLTHHFTRVIRKILHLLFSSVNKQYLGLAREMEFHADAVALSVSGSAVAISAMRRAHYLGSFMEYCQRKCAELMGTGIAPDNIFALQRELNRYLAAESRMEIADGIPLITDNFLNTFAQSRFVFQSQWSSHPSMEDREDCFKRAAIIHSADSRSARLLFHDADTLEQLLTAHYLAVNFPDMAVPRARTAVEIMASIRSYDQLYEYPAIYHGYYDNRPFLPLTGIADEHAFISFEELYSLHTVKRIRQYYQDQQDLQHIRAVAVQQLDIKYFRFDDIQYSAREAVKVIPQLEAEQAEEWEWLKQTDLQAFQYHQQAAGTAADGLRVLYLSVLDMQDQREKMIMPLHQVITQVQGLFEHPRLTKNSLTLSIAVFLDKGGQIKHGIRKLLQSGYLLPETDEPFLRDAAAFLETDYRYLHDDEKQSDEILSLYQISRKVLYYFDAVLNRMKKAYLEETAQYLHACPPIRSFYAQ